MVEYHHAIQKVWIEVGCCARIRMDHVACHVHIVFMAGLVQVFNAEDDRAALKSNPPAIFGHGWVGLEQPR